MSVADQSTVSIISIFKLIMQNLKFIFFTVFYLIPTQTNNTGTYFNEISLYKPLIIFKVYVLSYL